MAEPFPHLFSPLALRHRTLNSRLVFGAPANVAEDGLPSERRRDYRISWREVESGSDR